MKTLPFIFLVLLPSFLWAQFIDSTTIKQVDSLIQVSRTLTEQSDFDKALEVNAAAEKLALDNLGRESAAYGSCCFNRGRVLWLKGDYLEAEKWYLESKDIRGKALGKEHPDYARSLNSLAILYYGMSQYDKAEPLYLESKDIRGKALGKEHPAYAWSLNNLAILYQKMSNYEKAEPLYLEALAIREKTLGKEHPDYAGNLNNLAILYHLMSNYEKAEPFYLEALAIREKALGKEHPDYAGSLNNLAVLYHDMGNFEKAEPLVLEAKAIREKALGKENPEYAQSLNNMALFYRDMGNYEKAEPLVLEAKAILEKALGKEHRDYAASVNDLANLYWSMGNYEKAEPLYLEAKAIWEKALGKEHRDYAGSLNNLANLYHTMSDYEKAEILNLEAIAIWEKLLGKEHPDYAHSLNDLAELYTRMGNYEKAKPLFDELANLNQSLITKALHHLSERELNSYLHKFSESQAQTLSFAQLFAGNKSGQICFDNSLFYKGFLLNAANQVKRLALTDSTTTEKFNLLKSYERRLAAQYAQPIAYRDSANVASLEAKANDLEKDLARTVAGYGEATRQVKWQEVQQKLKFGEAAIEFVNYHYYEKKQTDSTMYAALLLRPGDEQPIFIPLFEEKKLAAVLAPDNKEQRSELFAQIYSRGAQPLKTTELTGLYELIWQPLDSLLSKTKTAYFSPSGLLHRFNFDAIPTSSLEGGKGGERTLADRFQLVRLYSTRSLVVPDLTKVSTANDAVLYGSIQYEIDTAAIAKDSTVQGLFAGNSAELSFTYADRSMPSRGNDWNYLPGTEKEVSSIHALLQKSKFSAQVFSGEAATEESFKSIGKGKPSPRILHIATHGFFFPDPVSVRSPQSTVGSQESAFKMSDHPMIRSGLILAGGNYAWQTGKPLEPNMEDGILTAYEISQMNLSNTELVVLSACETGLGDIQGNEGVYGLQRAFKIAGAKYLVMSLWQVPDQETSVFMTTFYHHFIEEKMTIPVAFRTTQREMRERFINPYQWAGFVLVE